jgi:hypothetical protein
MNTIGETPLGKLNLLPYLWSCAQSSVSGFMIIAKIMPLVALE